MRKLLAFLLAGIGCMMTSLAHASPDQPQVFSMGQVLELGIAGGATVNDDFLLCIGTDCDYWLEYNSGGTQFEFWTSDSNGGGADALVWIVGDGTDDFQTGISKQLTLDDDGDSFVSCTSDDSCRYTVGDARFELAGGTDVLQFYTNNTRRFIIGNTALTVQTVNLNLEDDLKTRWGDVGDYWIEYSSGDTQFELWTSDGDGGGTDTLVLQIDDGTDDLIVEGTSALKRESAEHVHVTLIDVDDTPYTATADDDIIIVDTDAGTGAPAAVTVNLPASACTPGADASCIRYVIKNIGGSSNVTVDADSAEEIDNALTQTLTPGDAITVIDAGQTDYHWIIE